MGTRRIDTRTLAIVSVTLVIAAAVLSRVVRARWTDHDVSDPGITL